MKSLFFCHHLNALFIREFIVVTMIAVANACFIINESDLNYLKQYIYHLVFLQNDLNFLFAETIKGTEEALIVLSLVFLESILLDHPLAFFVRLPIFYHVSRQLHLPYNFHNNNNNKSYLKSISFFSL